jgi:TP901 family phage tail tape measure protein
MARLVYEITGDITGLTNAVNQALNLVKKLNTEAGKIKFGAEGLSSLGAALATATSQTNQFTSAVNKNSQAFKDQTAANSLDKLGAKLNAINGNVQLFGSSLQTDQQSVRAFQTALNQLLSSGVDPLDKRVQALKSNIDGFNKSITEQKSLKSSSGGLFGSIGGQIAGVVAGYTSLFALIATGKRVIEFNSEVSDTLADVRRTASLTAAEADNLSESLKKIDTRTSLKGLLDIAVIAGQLGIAKDQIAGFTKVIDQLSVTLSGELKGGPKEIAESLGILDKVFGITAKNGGDIEKSFSQIGSVILGLGQSGLATGDFLAEFAKRVGGVAAQAKLSLPVLLSYGATLQEQGVQSEVAGSAFKRLISSLAVKRGAFLAVAQIADSSLTLKQFTHIINTDTQQALSLFFAGLAKGGSTTTQFQDLLKSIGLDAARSSQAITALALHQTELNTHIQESTKQFKDGTLAAEQFQIKNDTLGASIDKLGKAFNQAFQGAGISAFFKSIVDGVTNTITVFDKLFNSRSFNEAFQRIFAPLNNSSFDAANSLQDRFANVKTTQANLLTQSPQGFDNLSVEQLRALIPQYQKVALEAKKAFVTFSSQVQSGLVTDPENKLRDFKNTAIELNDDYKGLIASFLRARDAQAQSNKQTLKNIEELTDAQLTSIPQIKARIKELTELSDSGILGSDTNKRIIALNERLKELRGTIGSIRNVFNDINNSINDLVAKSNALAASTGLTGYAAEVQKVASEFANLNTGFDKVKANITQGLRSGRLTPARAEVLTAKNNAGQSQLGVNEQRALDAALVSEREKFNNDLQAIDDAFGVKAEQSRKAELAAVQKLANDKVATVTKGIFDQQQIEAQFNASVTAAKGNKDQIATATKVRDAEILAAQESATERQRIAAGVLAAQDAINQKYLTKERELQDSIQSIRDVALEDLSNKEDNATNKIVAGWDKRKAEAAKYFDQLRTIYPELSAIITKQQESTNNLLDAAKFRDVSVELSKNFASAMQTGVTTFADDFYTAITTLGATRQSIDDKYRQQYAAATDDLTRQQIAQQEKLEKSATTSFGAIFSSLISNALGAFNKSLFDGFLKKFTENIGTTLIKPNPDQLGLKVTGAQFSNTVVSAGDSFRQQIDAAAQAITSKINPQVLSGQTGGSVGGVGELIGSGLGSVLNDSSSAFSQNIDDSGVHLSSQLDTAATSWTQSSEQSSTSITNAGKNLSSSVLRAAGAFGAIGTGLSAALGGKVNISGTGNISSGLATGIAGASIAGGLISGATKPTSSAGQAIGGALSGAAAGASIGSIFPGYGTLIGGAIGFIAGGISGLLGASKAKKQEELQAAQLKAQQEGNALLLRQNALAYTTSIIGRMTQQGIVTGVDLNSFGQLTATVSGKNIQFVLDRVANGR